jgi:hypothetical protein
MDVEYSLIERLRQLEERLLEPNFRRNSVEVAHLLTEDFREFGSSGRIYNKRQVVEEVLKYDSDDTIRALSDFQAVSLAPDVILATYHVSRHSKSSGQTVCSWRSSIMLILDDTSKIWALRVQLRSTTRTTIASFNIIHNEIQQLFYPHRHSRFSTP